MFNWFRTPSVFDHEVVFSDDQNMFEKNGILIQYGAITNQPDQTWEWVIEQFEGWKYWRAESSEYCPVQARRKSWPFYQYKGIIKSWHIWAGDYGIDKDKHDERFFMGFGGVIGADPSPDGWVLIDGKRVGTFGFGWRPDYKDRKATDWERID